MSSKSFPTDPKRTLSENAIPISDRMILRETFTHRSWLNEHPDDKSASNERLEFLGDAVLELVVTRFLFDNFPDKPEGTLTSLRSSLVRTETLAKISRKIKIGSLLRLSHGEEVSGGRENESLLANSFEAVVGGIFLSEGMRKASSFIRRHLIPELDEIVRNRLDRDAKSLLQEIVQSKGAAAPTYRVEKELGPDHDKTFTVAVFIDGEKAALGSGKNKQLAQQEAARGALEKLRSV